MTDDEIIKDAEQRAKLADVKLGRVEIKRYSGTHNGAPLQRTVEYRQTQDGEWVRDE